MKLYTRRRGDRKRRKEGTTAGREEEGAQIDSDFGDQDILASWQGWGRYFAGTEGDDDKPSRMGVLVRRKFPGRMTFLTSLWRHSLI